MLNYHLETQRVPSFGEFFRLANPIFLAIFVKINRKCIDAPVVSTGVIVFFDRHRLMSAIRLSALQEQVSWQIAINGQ
jgi:hypothetical protein